MESSIHESWVNAEVRWILGGVDLDFRTIADFLKDNIDNLKKISNKFNKRLARASFRNN